MVENRIVVMGIHKAVEVDAEEGDEEVVEQDHDNSQWKPLWSRRDRKHLE